MYTIQRIVKSIAESVMTLVFQFLIIGVFGGFAIGGGWMTWQVVHWVINLFR